MTAAEPQVRPEPNIRAGQGRGRCPGLALSIVCLSEDLVHDGGAATDGGDDHVAVDGLGDVGGCVVGGGLGCLDVAGAAG